MYVCLIKRNQNLEIKRKQGFGGENVPRFLQMLLLILVDLHTIFI